MKKTLIALATLCITAALFSPLSAREAARLGLRPERPWSKEQFTEVADPALVGVAQEAAVDTYCIVRYDFETMNWQGWSRLDFTAQVDTFFHVDDFAGISPGTFGRLHPISGAKSMWCGARTNPADPYMCAWATAPGYGNNWDQVLATGALTLTGLVTFSFGIIYDSEPNRDITRVDYDAGHGDWQELASYSGYGSAVATLSLPLTQTKTKLRFHFTSDGSWSDQDILWNTDGACILDDITVSDADGFNNVQDFESAAVGAHRAGIWQAGTGEGYGKYSGPKANLGDKDPCNDNYATQIVFYLGSPNPAPAYPGFPATPFCKGGNGHDAPCQHEIVYSPVIDLKKYSTACNRVQNADIPTGDLSQLGGTLLRFTVYPDLPLANLVFYEWYIRTVDETGCPGLWESDNFVYYAGWGDPAYEFIGRDVSRFVTEDKVQIAVGVHDMCDAWYLVFGNCAEHTPAPWFDNVRLYRYKTSGPLWSYRDIDLFQDNFPMNSYLGSPPWDWVRADMANDIRPSNLLGIEPGDSIVVDCASPMGGGIDTMPNDLPAVYMHVNAHWIGSGTPPPALGAVIHGAQLQGTYGLWLSTDAGGWDIVQGDYARTFWVVEDGRYMFDLNDSLFVPGYIVEYYFTAVDNAAIESALPKWARSTGPYFEFTCLPTGTNRVLYVDDFDGRGSFNGVAEDYWAGALNMLSILGGARYDKYDVKGPSSAVSNGPGSRTGAALMQYQYDVIVWDSGDLENCTISDGTTNSDKSNDCQLLIDWMSTAEHPCGLWVCGDDAAYDLDNLGSVPATILMQTWCGVDFVNTSYFEVTGGRTGGGEVTPLITGDAAGIFYEGGAPERFYIYGGCPVVNMFDCIEKTMNGQYALDYPSHGGASYYAGIQSVNTNSMDQTVRTMWFGFSFMYIRDDSFAYPPIDRFEIARDVFTWMQQFTWTGVENPAPPGAWALSQNFPNPFNPATTIKYDVKEKGLVRVKVYNVAGQLVRTLVSEVKEAGSYTAVWDGKNGLGADVASGIFFCKMEAAGFGATRKMVLLR